MKSVSKFGYYYFEGGEIKREKKRSSHNNPNLSVCFYLLRFVYALTSEIILQVRHRER